MYVHTCCCTFIFVMSGFNLNSKGSKNYLKTNLKKIIQKNKKEFISSLLHFLSIRPAGHSCPAGLAWPAGQISPARSPPPAFLLGPAQPSHAAFLNPDNLSPRVRARSKPQPLLRA